MQTYFDANLGKFDKVFRRSNLLTEIDETDPSILSSKASIKMQYRLVPVALQTSYSLAFPSSILEPDESVYVVTSDPFFFNGNICTLRNKLNSNIIELLNTSTGQVEVDNIGSYSSSTGIITLVGFEPSLVSGDYIKVIATPANQATISPQRNNILNYDPTASVTNAVITDTI